MMPSYSPPGAKSEQYGDARNSWVDQSTIQPSYQGGGFSFQKRNRKIDWKKLAAIDVDRIAREVDIQTLQDNISHVVFCDVQNELNIQDLDPNLLKLFKLAQMLVEYLLYSQEFLQGYISQIESQMKTSVQNHANLREDVEKKTAAYRNLKKEYQKSKKLIAEYQMMLRAGASGFHKCPFCSKSFLSDEFLKGHILRRHSEKTEDATKLAQSGPKFLSGQNATRPAESFANQEDLLKELHTISTKLQETETRLVTEREERDRKFESAREIELRRIEQFSKEKLLAKDEEIAELKVTIEKHKDMFLKEIKELHSDRNKLQESFQELSNKRTNLKPSMLGELQDVSAEGAKEEKITQIKDQLQQELMSSYEAQLEKLSRVSRRREEQTKVLHEEEMKKMTEIISRYEESLKQNEEEKNEIKQQYQDEQLLYNDRFKRYEKMLDDQRMQMSKMEDILNSRRSRMADSEEDINEIRGDRQASIVSSTPVLRTSTDAFQDFQDSDDTILLYVASNAKNNFRVWKTSAQSSNEWKDSFTFKGNKIARGQFNRPIYVYYASGSPYWRQYVSSSSSPPRSSYRLDFIFYVSSVQLMGTTRLYVLDAGSGEVVKSMVSKSEIYPGWKQKGLSFYALKGPQSAGLSKSVSFQSTLNESEFDSGDDVSVSSYTGTEDARKHLAAEIARSRSKESILAEEKQDLQEEPKEKVEEKATEEVLQDEEDEDEEDADITLDETDGKLNVTDSTSQWGSTLLQTGRYFPFPNNPLAVARYDHSKDIINSCRQEAIEILNIALEKRGLDPEASGMDETQFATKMNMHANEVSVFVRRHPEEAKRRKRILEEVDKLAKERVKQWKHEDDSKIQAEKPSKSKFKSAVNKIKNAARFGRSSPRKEKDAKPKMRDLERTNSYVNKSFDKQTLERDKGSENDIEQAPISRKEQGSDNNDDIFDEVSEGSRWDSDEVSSDLSPIPTGTVQMPKVTVTMTDRQPEEPSASGVSVRIPRGEKVRALTESLEASLKSRGEIKKPAGSVDLHDTATSLQYSVPMINIEEPGRKIDNEDDDDDDFGLSSLEDDYLAPPSKRKEDDSESIGRTPLFRVDNNNGTRGTPSDSAPSRLSVNQTAISKFSLVDDFDDDSI